ncbi:MAG: DUF805 domain-containing protein [Ferrimicrobium sp.]
MGFFEAYEQFWLNYFNFHSRTSRAGFWKVVLINVVLGIIIFAGSKSASLLGLLIILYQIATIIPAIALSVRRLHDTNRSGWWYLIGLIPIVGSIVLLYFFVLPSGAESNRYGPPAIKA